MSETTSLAPFIKWGDYKSKDPKNPDILELKLIDPEPYMTEYSTCVRIERLKDGSWSEEILSLKSHSSNNASLLRIWTELLKKGQLKKGQYIIIKTYLGTTKKTAHSIRRYTIHLG